MPERSSNASLLAPTESQTFDRSSSKLHPHPWSTTTRQSSSPVIRSPFRQSFPAYSASTSAPNSPPMPETPSRRPRISEQEGHKRGESHSSPVPVIVRAPQDPDSEGSGRQPQAHARPHSRGTSPFPRLSDGSDANNGPNRNQNRRSVKHLTCFWWWEKGECRYSDEECLYSHYDTGRYTNPPRQVIPGEPAKAGKSLERALNKLAMATRSTVSLPSLPNATVNANVRVTTAPSVPETPIVDRSRSSTPSPLEIGQVTQLKADNGFLRTLVQQTQREKRALIDSIETLQGEKTRLQTQIDTMTTERSNLLVEREVLQAIVKEMRFSTSDSLMLQRQSPWGAIGSRRTSPVDSIPQRNSNGGPTNTAGSSGRLAATSNGGNMSVGPVSALNPIATPYTKYADVQLHLAQQKINIHSIGDAHEGEKLKNVLRNLGSSF
ncbi:uncharacterized protein Z518_00603 [Rhinocladiella mackenziei CBS 650.93]|uniref:Rhinocladiella mackenziei CBS 650.93 unplaced genomic scaffold supercont1.1, whole genome shotgun sequence n=1 Tax=Rhinocladiella mackenziei CBS 650.93 TaxID=1442369 RepID=A0A0D2HFV5_9EURO|nr:uncharacterized protein Z518_00603 [Rhinocladiella mackenziei CBS 650.93]KIX09523.1 hypothetical protein Z518_00603 [Rhinocladiella mackenziei CBS 650.93]